MTIKELLILVETELSDQIEVIDDQYLSDLLFDSLMHKQNWSNRLDIKAYGRIYFEYKNVGSFDLKQLEEALPLGYSVYYDTAHFCDIIIEHYADKHQAFNKFRKLRFEDGLVLNKYLIDNSKGIIVKGKYNDEIKTHQQKQIKNNSE